MIAEPTMSSQNAGTDWNFDSVLSLIHRLSDSNCSTGNLPTQTTKQALLPEIHTSSPVSLPGTGLGDFSSLWDYLGVPSSASGGKCHDAELASLKDDEARAAKELEAIQREKAVRWRDELDGADLEDNVDPLPLSASSLRTLKRAQRRSRAKERARQLHISQNVNTTDTATDAESDEELESVRRSPDRRALLANIIGRPLPRDTSPPTSPSPPKAEFRKPLKNFPVSNPSFWSIAGITPPGQKLKIVAEDGLDATTRKAELIKRLSRTFSEERKYLSNAGLMRPEFSLLNKSDIGVHVFIDMSNISIGFHDCLKARRNIPISDRVRRIPMNFHNFSLVLERGRPAARRALAGSDKTATIEEAESIGYEINILERVHKAKQLTPKQKKYMSRANANGNTSASGVGETSGSETNPGYYYHQYSSSSHHPTVPSFQPSKWVEQGVDEILHLKILESVVDAKKPSTIVLATGDAAEAEYSAGFLRMVERALEKGWVVELVSFEMNTSSAYKKPAFRNKWGPMFKWVRLDDFVELLIKDDIVSGSAV